MLYGIIIAGGRDFSCASTVESSHHHAAAGSFLMSADGHLVQLA
ncbi:MAG: hypothetical protein OET18_00010 [Desulfobacterales bacterium]|nr:hypothetical protein [Desulfobacterales bacterium]